jgi:UDP-GlcNAc:undecaprenyl-phosphate GlcNAc-1-phosphate transferase
MDVLYSPKQVLEGIWPVGLLAFAIALVLTPILRWIAYRTGIVDKPDDLLKPHGRPVAYLGGVGICIAYLVAIMAFIWEHPSRWLLASSIGASTVVAVLTGLLDDIVDLKPRKKLLGQVLAGVLLFAGLLASDITPAGIFFAGVFGVPGWLLAGLSLPFVLLVVISACNATNLLDGLDGLCGGVTGIISLGFLALTTYLACYGHHVEPDALRIMLCCAMAGGVLGFLPYNAPPASIFLGDAGSMLLGFFVATLMMLFALEGTLRWFLASCVIFGLPILDTSLAVIRRALSGKSIFTGDRSHLYDQLVDRGMSVQKVVILFYALALLADAIGVLQAIFLRTRYALLLDIGILVVAGVIFVRYKMIIPPGREPKS